MEQIERGFCKQSLDEQYALISTLNIAFLLLVEARTMYFIGAAVQVHELPQETAASINLRPFVTPCSAAVRAQHLESDQNCLQNKVDKKHEKILKCNSNFNVF